jgi:hypothetical protein
VRGNLPRIACLKLCQCTGQRSFRAMQNNFVDLCSDIAGGTIRAADELFDDRFAGRRSSTDRRRLLRALPSGLPLVASHTRAEIGKRLAGRPLC